LHRGAWVVGAVMIMVLLASLLQRVA